MTLSCSISRNKIGQEIISHPLEDKPMEDPMLSNFKVGDVNGIVECGGSVVLLMGGSIPSSSI